MENQLLILSVSELRRAAELKERIDALNDELLSVLGGSHIGNGFRAASTAGGSEVGSGKRRMSAAGRARIAAAAKARWARFHADKGGESSVGGKQATAVKKGKRTMSPAARAKIAAAARARWAKVRAAKE
jgi:hypothetical protein